MKQPKVATVPPPAPKPAQPSGPRYRYFSTTPTTVTLRMRDLKVPEKARTATYDSEQFVDLPCEDIFGGPVPKILLSKLARLAPECVTAQGLPDQGVNVCSARLALAYVVIEKRARLEDPAPPPSITEAELDVLFGEDAPAAENKAAELAEVPAKKPAAEEKPSDEKPKPPGDKPMPAVEKPAPAGEKPKAEPEEKKPSLLKIQPPKSLEPLAVKSLEPKVPAGETAPVAEIQLPKEEEKKPSAKIHPVPPAPKPSELEPAPAASEEQPPAGEVLKKPFGLFPMFRRKEAAEAKPSVAVPRSRIEIPKPRRPSSPITDAASPTPPEAPPAEPPADEPGAMAPIPPPAAKPSEEPTLLPKAAPVVPPPLAVAPIAAPRAASPAPTGVKPPHASQPIRIPSPPAAKFPPPFAASAPVPPVELPPAPPAPQPKPMAAPTPPPPPATEVPPPYASSAPAPAAELVEIPAPKAEPAKPAAEAPAPVAPIKEVHIPLPIAKAEPAVLVETEHLSSEKDRPEIAEQDALQAVFMTEEFLSVDRVLELCGNLPGIQSCVLSIGPSVVAAHNAPDTVDVVSLSAHAQEMLKAMRASSAKMGIGAVPAVTVHSEKGPITFFHQDDLCLLVLHKDRGFIPGVREKLQRVVTELAQAKLPLPVGKKLLGS